jgi:hypothetical protein
MRMHRSQQCIRSDNGAKFTASTVMKWPRDVNVALSFIEPGLL